ncbi:MAG: hypothetical protein M0Z65_09375 [Firmicutes bacterium]|nr:hypothetical protein [Bacillota bacterium]
MIIKGAAGAITELMPVEEHREGDRRRGVIDPFGHIGWMATHIKDVPLEEMRSSPFRYEGRRSIRPNPLRGVGFVIDRWTNSYGWEQKTKAADR